MKKRFIRLNIFFLKMRFSFHITVPTPKLEYMFEGAKKAEECGFFGVF